MNYAQSSVTAQIQALEKELGIVLFDRLGRSVQITDAGRTLLGYAHQILNLTEEAQSVVSGNSHPEGVLAVGAPETICTYRLPAVLRQFHNRYPEIQLAFRPMLDIDLHAGVRGGEIDVGFLLQEPLRSNGLIVENLVKEPLRVISAPDHRLAGFSMVTPADLEWETILLTESGCGYRHLFEHAITRDSIYSVVKLEFTSVEAIKQCVIAGLGIGFLPKIAVEKEIAQGLLCELAWEKPFQIYTQMVYSKEKWMSPAMKEFIRISREILGSAESS